MKKLYVNKEACIGCGMCVSIDPEHFAFSDDSYSEVISNENIDTDDAHNAISSCPTNAISYVSNEEEKDCDCEHCEHGCCNKDVYDNDEYDEAEA